MAGNISYFLESKILGHVTGFQVYSPPTTIWVGLFSTAPSQSGGGTELSSAANPGYYRQPVTWAAPSGTPPTIQNSNLLRWPPSGGVQSGWPSVIAIGLFDNLVGGNLLWWGPIAPSNSINVGDDFSIQPLGLTLKLT